MSATRPSHTTASPAVAQPSRRSMLRTATAMATTLAVGPWPSMLHAAEGWPRRSVRIVVPFGPGSASDLHARMVAEELQSAFGQPFVVDNKPGASGLLAAELVAKSPGDGYTLLQTSNTASSVNPFLFKKLPYDPIKDFTPIARLSFMPFVVLVSGSSSIRTLPQLVAHAKHNKVSYGYANATGQVGASTLALLAKFEASGVPYKGTPAAMTDLIGGHVDFMIGDLGSAAALIANQRVRPLAVITARRSALAPTLPSVAEALPAPDFDLPTWLGVLGPAGLPAPIVQALNTRITAMLERKGTAERLAAIGAEPAPATSAELDVYMRQQLEVWRVKVRQAGIEPQ